MGILYNPDMDVELTPEEAELFKQFMEHHSNFEYLIKSGAFKYNIPGALTLHLNASVHIGNMEWRPSVKLLINRKN